MKRRSLLQVLGALGGAAVTGFGVAGGRPGRVLQVGPTRELKLPSQAAGAAADGDTVLIDAGSYADVAAWQRDGLQLRAIGGRVRILAEGRAAEDKGAFVVRARGMRIEGFDFEGARSSGRNGAGIRLESGSLEVYDCRFIDNEMGLLTANDPTIELDISDSEFARNQRPDGHNHNLYVGQIARLSLRGCYLHHARTGHLLKSRAARNVVLANRLVDGEGGRASYELEFPNGGVAYVVGNTIEQSATTENEQMIAFGAEGWHWRDNRLYVTHNTLIDHRSPPGAFLHVAPGAHEVWVLNNRLVGGARLQAGSSAVVAGNRRESAGSDQRLGDAALPPRWATVDGMSLVPTVAFRFPRGGSPLAAPWTQPGAPPAVTHSP